MLLAPPQAIPSPRFRFCTVKRSQHSVERVVQACLAKEPNARPATARELSEWYLAALDNGADDGQPESPQHNGTATDAR